MSVVYIYGLIDPRNDKIFYIGYTQYLKKRYNVHLNVDGYRREKNLYKDNIIRKILNDGLRPTMTILDSCEKKYNEQQQKYEHELLEIQYIEKYKRKNNKLTNLTNGGEGGRTKLQPVYQYNENGIFLKEYQSVNQAAENYNVGADIISKAIDQRGKKSYRSTYLFSSKEKGDLFVFKKLVRHYTPIVQYSFNGEFIEEYKSQKEASIITNISQPSINNCLRKKREQAGGYLWYYKNNEPANVIEHVGKYSKMLKPIIQYDLTNKFIRKFKSIGEAKRTLGISSSLIVTNLKGITKTCKGFVFKYENKVNNII